MDKNSIKQAFIRNRFVKYLYYAFRPRYVRKTISEYLDNNLEYTVTKKQIALCVKDFMHFRWKYQGSLETDFLGTQMYRKSDFVREESFADKSRYLWRDSLQDKKYWDIFLDKRRFYAEFQDLLNRKWMIVDQHSDLNEIKSFISSCGGKAFVKIPESCGGKGVFTISLGGGITELIDILKTNEVIIEEAVKQCNEMACFSGNAVNTLRIVTLIDNHGIPHVARCVFRIGRARTSVDNFSSGGMAANVDVETGIIFTTAQDKRGHQYIVHPDTGKQIVGFNIPDWNGYKEFAIKLASRFPTMRYVGWDIVKMTDGRFCVIEGNKDAGMDVMESNIMYGLKPVYNEILHS